jgi:hypothetical protein
MESREARRALLLKPFKRMGRSVLRHALLQAKLELSFGDGLERPRTPVGQHLEYHGKLFKIVLARLEQVSTLDAVRGNLAERGGLKPQHSREPPFTREIAAIAFTTASFPNSNVKRRKVARSAKKPQKWLKTVARSSPGAEFTHFAYGWFPFGSTSILFTLKLLKCQGFGSGPQ